MVFEGSPLTTTGTGSRYLGEGFRHEPDFRDGTAPLDGVVEVTVPAADPSTTGGIRRIAKPNLEYVFDDPAHGEPGRDRMLVHGLWELVLALAVAGVGYLLWRAESGAFQSDALRTLALDGAILGLLAAATAIALRAGVPNLAVGAVAVAAGLYFGQHGGGAVGPMLAVVGLCAAVGLVQGLLVAGLQVPSWAASFGVAIGLLIWIQRFSSSIEPADGYDARAHSYYWFGGFAAVSVLAGLVSLFPAVRRGSGRFRPVADPADRRGLVAALVAVGATVASSVLAGLGGVLVVATVHQAQTSDELSLTAFGLGAALLGGTSAYGRRGGVLGTVLAVALLTLVGAYERATHREWSALALAAVAIALGLGVTRLVERFGRPNPGKPEDEEEEWAPRMHTGIGTDAPPPRTWPPATAPTTRAAGGLWASDEAWGAAERQ